MPSKATTVAQYLAELPSDRREALETVRKTILANLDRDYEEGMQYGMIGYYVPHTVFPPGYHCDPRQPLPFAGLGSQKNHMSLHLMCVYGHAGLTAWFQDAWKKTGKKLDMGKACVRFKRAEDLALDVIGEVIRRVPADKYIAFYEANLRTMSKKKTASKKATSTKAKSKKAKSATVKARKTQSTKAGRRSR